MSQMNSELSVHESVKRIEQCINVFFLEDQEKSRTATQYYPWTNYEKKRLKIESISIFKLTDSSCYSDKVTSTSRPRLGSEMV